MLCLAAFIAGSLPLSSPAAGAPAADPRVARALALLNGQSCAVRAREWLAQETPPPSPTPLPNPSKTPGIPRPILGPPQLFATPFPTGSPAATPPPVPTATPSPNASAGPVFLTRPSAPPSITPVGSPTPSPSPKPVGIPTMRPGYTYVLADKVVGNPAKPGAPADAIGNVHIFYENAVLVGDRAHYDGDRTITVTGHPYIVNSQENSIYHADEIDFDTIAQTAELKKGQGESSQGVERGLVYFGAQNMKTNAQGVAHGTNANLTTCEHPRSGYHITGKTIDVYPGDKIVISKVLLWLGGAAVFFLPRVIIPLRTVSDERQKPQLFPDVGYNSYQGFYVKARLGFGRDQYYYGYYRVEFYSREGIGLGYDATITKKNGKRQTTIDFYGIHDRRAQQTTYNLNVGDIENFSQHLRGQFGFTYNSNFGPLVSLPPSSGFTASVVHSGTNDTQTYSFARSSTGSQSSTENYGFTDSRTFTPTLDNTFAFTLNHSQSNYGFFSQNSSATVDDLLHWSNAFADYTLNFDKSFSQTPVGVNKEPELQIRPYQILPHFIFPVSTSLTIGEYSEPQTPEHTQRADLNLTLGPALYRLFGSDLSANVTIDQLAYGTGDLKASILETASLTTPVSTHFVNALTYTANQYNGPPFVPFATIDQQPANNYKNAADVMRFFNGDYYNLLLSFNTSFNMMAQPVQYQLAFRPSPLSYVTLGGAFTPGPGQGFYSTNVGFITPFGRNADLQFLGDINWKEGGRIENETIYYRRIIGDCYQLQLQYNSAYKSLNVTVNLLAFPSRAASFNLSAQGPIVPTSFNGYLP